MRRIRYQFIACGLILMPTLLPTATTAKEYFVSAATSIATRTSARVPDGIAATANTASTGNAPSVSDPIPAPSPIPAPNPFAIMLKRRESTKHTYWKKTRSIETKSHSYALTKARRHLTYT